MKPNQFVLLFLTLTLCLAACSSGDLLLSTYLRTHADELNQPMSNDDSTVRFTVAPGTPARTIGNNLLAAGLIGDARLFEAYVRVNGLANQLEAGTFGLRPSMTLVEIVEALQRSKADSVRITIPEGWRIGQIVDYFEEIGLFDSAGDGSLQAYEQQVTNGFLVDVDAEDYPFLRSRPAGAGLEGYLFPDTYEIPMQETQVADVLERQLDNFAAKVLPVYAQAVREGKTELDLYAVLTLASIVEREAVVPEERPAIARVYLNRLDMGMKLDADPTVQYALGYQPESDQWWKTPIFLEEYSGVDSPYNTYLYPGLPPGPIANPGLGSIEAVLNPDEHNYVFFVALPQEGGRHIFAETYEEHLENVRNYLEQ